MRIGIEGQDFSIDGTPTYHGRTWQGQRIEGLLLNARMVQATFDDLNPATRDRWAYPDSGVWDPERNVRELIAMLPEYRRHGLLAITVNFQGGSPEGYSREQPWENSAFEPDGSAATGLRPSACARSIVAADAAGLAVIVGYFYQGQDERLADEAAVLHAVDQATDFLLEGGFPNVLVEINNECNTRYEHAILQPPRVHELIERVKSRGGGQLLVSTSYGGRGRVPDESVGALGRLSPAPRQRHGRPRPDRRAGRRDARLGRLSRSADPVQRGRPLRVRSTAEQLSGSAESARVVGLLRPGRGRQRRLGAWQLPGRLSARARQLADQHRAQARLLRPARGRNRRGIDRARRWAGLSRVLGCALAFGLAAIEALEPAKPVPLTHPCLELGNAVPSAGVREGGSFCGHASITGPPDSPTPPQADCRGHSRPQRLQPDGDRRQCALDWLPGPAPASQPHHRPGQLGRRCAGARDG